ncbi:RNA methyltransferase [Halodesulfurarchaeum sp. HSR-GB]|uniref:RNA methyltransferase n=1 Tax=Halodesulfurarchaeum sp. HSR-GB TaxID=3074077 RepID=UPI00285FE2B0|nr:RNA methyltransferase [Halodesulfurarchaeum sp. HSR-GB]MDR5657153.1 RNA methyltransferase [Halodesulfurarchaeum sp. HSR-GB]
MSEQTPVVVIVDAQTPGNVGTIARSMKNFGFSELLLVDPPALDPDGEAYGFAGQAREDVLPNARETTFEAVLEAYHTVGFTAVTNEDETSHVRFPFKTPRELAESLTERSGPTALVFGREPTGLHNEELAQLDEICAIPASESYPVLNLGQAATIALYELRNVTLGETQLPDRTGSVADPADVERFHEHVGQFLESIEYGPEKRAKTQRLVRRLLGRAKPTGQELVTLRGVMRQAVNRNRE